MYVYPNYANQRVIYSAQKIEAGIKPQSWRMSPICGCGKYEIVELTRRCMTCERKHTKPFFNNNEK